jgi:hypothetical protein
MRDGIIHSDVASLASVKTDQVVVWWMFGFHLNAVTHMALDRLFPSGESEVTSAAGALAYVGSAWLYAAIYAALMSALLLINHESGHYAAGVKGGNLRRAVMEPILEKVRLPLSRRLGWTIGNFFGRFLIPFGKFNGIVRPKALDYELDGAAPLLVRAAGPKRDLILGIPVLAVSLVGIVFLSTKVGETTTLTSVVRQISEWLFPAGVAVLYGAFRYDNGALLENYRVNKEQKRIIAEGRKARRELAFDTGIVKKKHQEGTYGE